MDESELTPDFRDLLKLLNDHGVEYLVVGGYAVIAHGYARATKDLDIWLAIGPDNADRATEALREFIGQAPPRERLLSEDMLLRIGRPPTQIEVFTSISGVDFHHCYQRRMEIDMEGVTMSIIGLTDLRINKRAAGRSQDLADLDNLPET